MNPHTRTAPASWGEPGSPIAVLGLHGRGQSPDTICELRARASDENFWFAPRAASGEWYPHRFMDAVADDDPWIDWALAAVDDALTSLGALGYPPGRVVVLGFSQGGCLAAHYALLHPQRYAGLALLTGGFIGPAGVVPGVDGDFAATPTLIASVERDAWVPLERVRETEQQLRSLHAEVTSLIEPGEQHGVTDPAVSLLRRMLRAASVD